MGVSGIVGRDLVGKTVHHLCRGLQPFCVGDASPAGVEHSLDSELQRASGKYARLPRAATSGGLASLIKALQRC